MMITSDIDRLFVDGYHEKTEYNISYTQYKL